MVLRKHLAIPVHKAKQTHLVPHNMLVALAHETRQQETSTSHKHFRQPLKQNNANPFIQYLFISISLNNCILHGLTHSGQHPGQHSEEVPSQHPAQHREDHAAQPNFATALWTAPCAAAWPTFDAPNLRLRRHVVNPFRSMSKPRPKFIAFLPQNGHHGLQYPKNRICSTLKTAADVQSPCQNKFEGISCPGIMGWPEAHLIPTPHGS